MFSSFLQNSKSTDCHLLSERTANFTNKDLSIIDVDQLNNDNDINLSSVTILHLGYNKFRTLPYTFLESLSSLRVLNLEHNSISIFTENIGKVCPYLEELYLNHNKLESFNSTVLKRTHLQILVLSFNKLTYLSEEIGDDLPHLTILKLNHNYLRSIPASLGTLVHLKDLDIRVNQFFDLPITLGHLPQLTTFNLDWFRYSTTYSDDSMACCLNTFKEMCFETHAAGSERLSCSTFIRRITNPYTEDWIKDTTFHIAVSEGHYSVVKILLDHDINIHVKNTNGHSPIVSAVKENQRSIVNLLCDFGANVNDSAGPLGTALHIATVNFNYDICQRLLKSGGDPNSVDEDGNTPLHVLMSVFDTQPILARKIGQLFLQYHIHCNAVNYDLWAPIHLASRRGQIEGIRFIIDNHHSNSFQCRYGLCSHIIIRSNNYHSFECSKIHPLHLTQQSTISTALSTPNDTSHHTLNVSSIPILPLDQLTPYNIITSDSDAQLSSEYNFCSYTFNLNLRGGLHKWSALHLAGHACQARIVIQLISAGANVIIRNETGRTPRQVSRGNVVTTKLLKAAEDTWYFFKTHPSIRNTVLESASPSLQRQSTIRLSNSNDSVTHSLTKQNSIPFIYPHETYYTMKWDMYLTKTQNIKYQCIIGVIPSIYTPFSNTRHLPKNHVHQHNHIVSPVAFVHPTTIDSMGHNPSNQIDLIYSSDNIPTAGISSFTAPCYQPHLKECIHENTFSSVPEMHQSNSTKILTSKPIHKITSLSNVQEDLLKQTESHSDSNEKQLLIKHQPVKFKQESKLVAGPYKKKRVTRQRSIRRIAESCSFLSFYKDEWDHIQEILWLTPQFLFNNSEQQLKTLQEPKLTDRNRIAMALSYFCALSATNIRKNLGDMSSPLTSRVIPKSAAHSFELTDVLRVDILRFALKYNCEDLARQVMSAFGPDIARIPQLRSFGNETALHLVCQSTAGNGTFAIQSNTTHTNHYTRADLLLYLLQLKDTHWDINARDAYGLTPLHLAAKIGDSNLVRILLLNGADPNIAEFTTGWTPLHFSVSHSHYCVTVELLFHPLIDPDKLDNFEWSPLAKAVLRLDVRTVGALVNRGASLLLNGLMHEKMYNLFGCPDAIKPIVLQEDKALEALRETQLNCKDIQPHIQFSRKQVLKYNGFESCTTSVPLSRIVLKHRHLSDCKNGEISFRLILGQDVNKSKRTQRIKCKKTCHRFVFPDYLISNCYDCHNPISAAKSFCCQLCSVPLCHNCYLTLLVKENSFLEDLTRVHVYPASELGIKSTYFGTPKLTHSSRHSILNALKCSTFSIEDEIAEQSIPCNNLSSSSFDTLHDINDVLQKNSSKPIDTSEPSDHHSVNEVHNRFSSSSPTVSTACQGTDLSDDCLKTVDMVIQLNNDLNEVDLKQQTSSDTYQTLRLLLKDCNLSKPSMKHDINNIPDSTNSISLDGRVDKNILKSLRSEEYITTTYGVDVHHWNTVFSTTPNLIGMLDNQQDYSIINQLLDNDNGHLLYFKSDPCKITWEKVLLCTDCFSCYKVISS